MIGGILTVALVVAAIVAIVLAHGDAHLPLSPVCPANRARLPGRLTYAVDCRCCEHSYDRAGDSVA